jgi:hypothetical protein
VAAGFQSTHAAYPVTLEVDAPERFERIQLLLRVLVLVGAGALHNPIGGLLGSLYLLLPIIAAVLISQRGGSGFLDHDAGWLGSALDWIVALQAYMLFVTDRFPLEAGKRSTRLHVSASGTPTVGSALVRLFTSLPHALVLALLGCVAWLISLCAVVSILATENYPQAFRDFQRAYLGWIARVLAYHVSLVEAYPPFAMDTDTAPPPALQ